ncbi:MAG: hypothetical protein ACE5HS_10875 [bacterium]
MIKLHRLNRNNERGRKLRHIIFLVGLCNWQFMNCTGSVPDDLILESQPAGIIFVKATRTNTLNSFSRGGNLFSLIPASPDGKLTNLTNLEAGDVADPEISFDGLKVLFAMRRNSGERFHIHEMNVDGSGLRQLTFDAVRDDFDPTYLPNGKILFTSNRPGFIDEYNKQNAEVMHVMEVDGSNIEQISFNASDDFDPIVTKTGHVVYTRWEHHGPINRFPLFITNPDGHGTFTFFSPHNHRTFFHPRELADGSIIAVKSNMVNGDRGPLVIIKNTSTAGEPLEEGFMEIITPEIELNGPPYSKGVFKYPHPLPDGRILVSYSPPHTSSEEADYGLYTLNTDGSDLKLLYNDPQFQEFDAVVIGDRAIPPVINSKLDKAQTTGVFTVQNAYFRQERDGQVRPDQTIREIRQVMVIEGMVRPKGDRAPIGMTNFEQKRILGVAPVQTDGSFSIRVPANIPLSFNTLDSLGRALVVKRNWVTIRPGEHFEKCSGCHGPRGRSSNNPNPLAASLPPTDLNVPAAQREDVSFGTAIEPIIAAKCTGCHSGAAPAANLPLTLTKDENDGAFSVAYVRLLEDSGYVRAPFSRRSKLIERLLGLGDYQARGPHPAGEQTLNSDEVRKFINWIDLGGQYR